MSWVSKSAEKATRNASVKKVLAITKRKGKSLLENYNDEKWSTIKVPAYDGWESMSHEGWMAVWFRIFIYKSG